jgi:hypothetical protein
VAKAPLAPLLPLCGVAPSPSWHLVPCRDPLKLPSPDPRGSSSIGCPCFRAPPGPQHCCSPDLGVGAKAARRRLPLMHPPPIMRSSSVPRRSTPRKEWPRAIGITGGQMPYSSRSGILRTRRVRASRCLAAAGDPTSSPACVAPNAPIVPRARSERVRTGSAWSRALLGSP